MVLNERADSEALLTRLTGLKRRIVHAASFEVLAIVLASGLMALAQLASPSQGLMLSAVLSLIAMAWNMAFNALFEHWEARQAETRRTLKRRLVHTAGFEGGLVLWTVPVIAWMLDMHWWQALVTDLGLMLFFLVYTFVFNWAFDLLFGLPDLGQAPPPANP